MLSRHALKLTKSFSRAPARPNYFSMQERSSKYSAVPKVLFCSVCHAEPKREDLDHGNCGYEIFTMVRKGQVKRISELSGP